MGEKSNSPTKLGHLHGDFFFAISKGKNIAKGTIATQPSKINGLAFRATGISI
jgi:hypothetical protein